MPEGPPRNPPPPLPKPDRYDRFEMGAILALIAVFLGLFIWLPIFPGQQLYQYLTFALVTTLVLSGILKAVGAYKSTKVALGGSIVIFGTFFYLTKGLLFDKQKLELDDQKAQTNQYIQKFNTADGQLTKLRTDLANIINRDIVISTYTNEGGNQHCAMIVNYYDNHDNPKVAVRAGNTHVIKWSDFDSTLGISFDVDPSCTPARRLDQSSTVKIDHISFHFDSLGRVDRFDPVSTTVQAFLQTAQ